MSQGPGREAVLGRWDVTVEGSDGPYPSWFEIREEEGVLTGSFVGRVGSARSFGKVSFEDGKLEFSLPVQYESHPEDMKFTAEVTSGGLAGTTNAEDGSTLRWTALRAPDLKPAAEYQWGEPIPLFNGQDLSGWKPRSPALPNHWVARDGMLVNTEKGSDLVTEDEYRDFRLQLEFQYPEGSNSGIYLRGRYEVQIQDDYGKEPGSLFIGGVYGFVTPTKNAGRKAGEWQSYDITLLGRHITVVLNGEKVIDDQEIPGITGGALDSDEGQPGPIFLQGDHGPVNFRNIRLASATPAR